MADKSRNESRPGSLICKSHYADCMQTREHESVGRMKFAQCNCGCSPD
ncbi:MAG: hypothetical protein QNJ61_08675 [Desulfobacterales bacterium]|nr:hypothetical protein [Desulfobacterales bacterium]